jgi:glycosyltransferase involved in cell wall biosynthesis
LAVPGSTVVGARRGETFAGVDYFGMRGALGVARAIRRFRPEAIDVHQQPRLAMFLALLFPRVRVLLFLHNDPCTMRGLRSGFGRWLARRLLHRVVCVSGYLAARFGPGAEVLWNPLTLAELPARGEVRKPVILFAGRMTADKAPDVFVAACAATLPQLPGWHARMIGGDRFGPGSPETAFVAKVRDGALRAGIAFEGPRPHTHVLAAMAEAAIVVVPSRWPEPFGLTALEAMASGAALITTGTGGLREVAGDAAMYVAVDDVPGLAEAMVALAGDPAVLAARGLERAKRFDTALISAKLARLRGVDQPVSDHLYENHA